MLEHLEQRFRDCANDKHSNLIRQDVIQSIKSLYDQEKDEALLSRARKLALTESEVKYRKKYEAILG